MPDLGKQLCTLHVEFAGWVLPTAKSHTRRVKRKQINKDQLSLWLSGRESGRKG